MRFSLAAIKLSLFNSFPPQHSNSHPSTVPGASLESFQTNAGIPGQSTVSQTTALLMPPFLGNQTRTVTRVVTP
jgi:hypothetical protein